MDPQAAWDSIATYLEAGDISGATIAAHNLKGWLDRGGFYPEHSHRPPSVVKDTANHKAYIRTILAYLLSLEVGS